MTTAISTALAEILNLSNFVTHHKQVCHDIDCNASIYLAKMTAMRLANRVEPSERERVEEILRLWPL